MLSMGAAFLSYRQKLPFVDMSLTSLPSPHSIPTSTLLLSAIYLSFGPRFGCRATKQRSSLSSLTKDLRKLRVKLHFFARGANVNEVTF